MLIGGCASPAARQSAQISNLVSLEGKEIAASRFDLVKKTQANLQRLVPVSKSKIVINTLKGAPIFKPGDKQSTINNVIVLPDGTNLVDANVVAANSAAFNAVINATSANKTEEKKDESLITSTNNQTTAIIAAVAAAKANPPHGLLWWALHIFSYLGIVGVVGLIVLLIFFPTLLPIVLGILKDLYDIIAYIFTWIGSWFKK